MNIGNESLTYNGGPAVVPKTIEEILMTKEAQRIIKRTCWDLCKAVENPLVYSGRNGCYIKHKGKNLSRENWEKVLIGEIELEEAEEFKDERFKEEFMPVDTSFIANAFELAAIGCPGSEFYFSIYGAGKDKSKGSVGKKRINNNYHKKYYPKHWREMYSLNMEV